MVILYILIAIVIFGIIILIHEFGHFIVAKACDIKVNEFAIGMGPKIFSFGKGETKFSLRAIPMGGYVSMEGEDEDSQDPRAFNRKKVWQRLLVVLAGAAMNLLLGIVVLVVVTSFSDAIITTQIAKFATDDALSHTTGLEIGDEIVEVNGMKIFCDTDISYQFQTDEDLSFEMVVKRNGEKVTLPAVQFEATEYEDGTRSLHIDFIVVGEKVTPLTVIDYSAKKFVSVARMIWLSLGDLLSGKYGLNELSGPVGIVGAIGDVVGSTQHGVPVADMLANLASFVVFITINVGIFNLLPVPALDGSRALFLVIEGIRRKPLKPEVEGMIHMIGMLLLIGLMIVVTVSDIFKLF